MEAVATRRKGPPKGSGARGRIRTTDLCPRCAVREIVDAPTGFCEPCATDRHLEAYRDRDAREIPERRDEWRHRTKDGRETRTPANTRIVQRERQRRHRLLEAMRPREPADGWRDPFELGREALAHLARLRHPRISSEALAHVLAAEELVRQLAWGPEDRSEASARMIPTGLGED
jgi:hypothetical protein